MDVADKLATVGNQQGGQSNNALMMSEGNPVTE